MGSLNLLPIELRMQIFSYIPYLHVDDGGPVEVEKDDQTEFVRYLLFGDYRQRSEYLTYRAPRAKLSYESGDAWPDYAEHAFFQGNYLGLN